MNADLNIINQKDNDKIVIRRLKKRKLTLQEQYSENFEEWVAYWRENPHRFITDYLGLTLYDFQKVLIWEMNKHPNYCFIGSRGIAKSSLTLDFACQRAILYPNQKILVVCPVKSQSRQFVKKIYEYIKASPSLANEIDIPGIKTGINESKIPFKNGSTIFTTVYSENSLGIRAHILIVDEFVRTEKAVISRVFVPMLSDSRKPRYANLSRGEKMKAYEKEQLMKIYLSSIRRADEWSYDTFCQYADRMTNGNTDYCTTVISYILGVKNGFINRKQVEENFRENMESYNMLLAEYLGLPERGSGNSFFTYPMFSKVRNESRALCCMSDEEFIEFKDNKKKFPYYQEKLPNELRILCMDIAVIESKNNDNTAFFIIRLIPNGGKYTKIVAYADSLHGLNSMVQAKRTKQLFYELECDYCVMDTQGVGIGIFDACTTETYDTERGVTYPAWTVINPDDVKMVNRTIDRNAVPVIYSVRTPIQLKSAMFTNMRNLLTDQDIVLLQDKQEAIEYLVKHYHYYKIEDEDLRSRLINPYVQTNRLIDEATSLEQVVTQGYINLKEKQSNRKDRVMALAYGLWFAKLLENEYITDNSTDTLEDWVFFG